MYPESGPPNVRFDYACKVFITRLHIDLANLLGGAFREKRYTQIGYGAFEITEDVLFDLKKSCALGMAKKIISVLKAEYKGEIIGFYPEIEIVKVENNSSFEKLYLVRVKYGIEVAPYSRKAYTVEAGRERAKKRAAVRNRRKYYVAT